MPSEVVPSGPSAAPYGPSPPVISAASARRRAARSSRTAHSAAPAVIGRHLPIDPWHQYCRPNQRHTRRLAAPRSDPQARSDRSESLSVTVPIQADHVIRRIGARAGGVRFSVVRNADRPVRCSARPGIQARMAGPEAVRGDRCHGLLTGHRGLGLATRSLPSGRPGQAPSYRGLAGRRRRAPPELATRRGDQRARRGALTRTGAGLAACAGVLATMV